VTSDGYRIPHCGTSQGQDRRIRCPQNNYTTASQQMKLSVKTKQISTSIS